MSNTKLIIHGHYLPNQYTPCLLYPDSNPGELMTKQSDAESCDINNILYQFTRTGLIEHINQSQAQWLDLPDSVDYQQSLQRVAEAQAAFDSLPAPLRKKYENEPERFLYALSDPAERPFLTEHGIFKPAPPPPPPPAAPPASPDPAGAL